MKFRTEINIDPQPGLISHSSSLMMLGSCFADNIGARLAADGFDVSVNPVGVLYNPLSILRAISHAISDKVFEASELIHHDGLWHSMDHHTTFSASTQEEALLRINASIKTLRTALMKANVVFVTLGSAYVYRYNSTGEVVANCHKLPAAEFTRQCMSVEEAADAVQMIVKDIHQLNPDARVIFTVSPIRHLADGLHGNQISKATLLLAIEAAGAQYFPAYEIMMDDLRDYRFYASDLKHPSDLAVDYIYSKFAETFFTSATRLEAALRHKQILKQLHRPIAK